MLKNPYPLNSPSLQDPTATNMPECTEYVAQAGLEKDGLYAHQSEHASFQIVNPKATIRLRHGRLHQFAMRDPTDQFGLLDHLTWQMNMAADHNEVVASVPPCVSAFQGFAPTIWLEYLLRVQLTQQMPGVGAVSAHAVTEGTLAFLCRARSDVNVQVSRDAKGILGETRVPTRDHDGKPIMQGMEAIRGQHEDRESCRFCCV